MNKSRYFANLIQSYNDEIDDLVTDSEGKSVLQKRLNDKRGAIETILPMIEFSPEMVSVVFYGAFGFPSSEVMRQLVLNEPDDAGFLAWSALEPELIIADWAEPLVKLSLKASGGDTFLVTTAGLEYLRTQGSTATSASGHLHEKEQGLHGDDGKEPGDDEDRDLNEAGADWLAEQGFDPLDR